MTTFDAQNDVRKFTSATLLAYELDLLWLETTHPEEFALLPSELLYSDKHFQLHAMCTDGDEPIEDAHWVICFLPRNGSGLEDTDPIEIHLNIARPPDPLNH